MWIYILLSFAVFCIGIIFAVIAYAEMSRPDAVFISDAIDRERVNKFLNLSERAKDEIVSEIDDGLHDELR